MNPHYVFSSNLTWITTLGLVAFVFLSGRRSRAINAFCFYMFNISAWSFGWSRMAMATDPISGLFWARALHVGAIIIPTAFFRFSLVLLPESVEKKWTPVVRAGYALSAFFLIFSFSNLFVPRAGLVSGMPYYPQPGPLYIPYVIFFAVYSTLAFWTIARSYRESSGLKQNQMRYVLVAYAIAWVGGCPAFLPVFGFGMWPYSFYGVILCMLLLTYTVLTQRLLDIVVLTRNTVVQVIATTLSDFPFVISAYLARLLWNWPGFALNNGPGPLICAVTSLSLVLTMFTVYKNPHARRFSNLCVFLGIWNSTALFLCIPETPVSVWAYRIGYGVACLVVLAWFSYWRGYFYEENPPTTKATGIFVRSAWIMLPLAGFTPLVLKSLTFDPEQLKTAMVIPGPAHWLFSLWFLAMVVGTGIWPIREWMKSLGDTKRASGFWMFGSFVLAASAATTYFLFVQFEFPWYWYPILEFLMLLSLAGALIYRLPLTEGQTRGSWARELGRFWLLTFVIPMVVGFLYTQKNKAIIFVDGTLFLIGAGFLMWRIYRPVQEWVDQTAFFRKEFGHLAKAKVAVQKEWNLDSLEHALPLVTKEILESAPYKSCTIAIMFDDQPKRPYFRSTHLRLAQGEIIEGVPWPEPLIMSFLQLVRGNGALSIRKEMASLPPLVQELDPLLFEASVPVVTDGKIVGVVVMGPKEGKDASFHNEDIKILTTLANTLSKRLGPSVGLNLFRCIVGNTLHDVLGHNVGPLVDQLIMERPLGPDLILGELRKMREALKGLRSYAQGELEKGLRKEPDPLDMENLLKGIFEIHKVFAEKKGLKFELNITNTSGLPKPRLDQTLVERSIGNLVTNAVKYTLHGRVELLISHEDKFLMVSVRDTGIGIPKDSLNRIFEAGYRVPGHATDVAEGTGVGLANVQEMMAAMGGRVEVQSEPGTGSTFTLYFPLPSEVTEVKARVA